MDAHGSRGRKKGGHRHLDSHRSVSRRVSWGREERSEQP
jgi:hypothetical protein